MDGDPGADLMLRFQNGDDNAFAELVGQVHRRVINLIYRYIGDAVEAEDLAQEVFLKLWKARLSYEPSAKFSTWLYRIVVNLCLNDIRDRKRMIVKAPPEEILSKGGEDGIPTALSREEMRALVKGAIEALPENQRMAVILVQYEGLSYEDASGTMGIGVGALKSLLFRARDNLKQRLERYVDAEEMQ